MNFVSQAVQKYRQDGLQATLTAGVRRVAYQSRMWLYHATHPNILISWVTSEYHKHYVHNGLHRTTTWQGVPIVKCPMDLMVYQELIHELNPDIIIECGTHRGGSSLFFSDICDAVGSGSVVSIDIEAREDRPQRDNLTCITGSSTNPDIVSKVKEHIDNHDTVMAILDSDHSKSHVLDELYTYGDIVTPGSYLLVEDTDINGHPVKPLWGPGPMEAVEKFLQETNQFEKDTHRERFGLTFCPNGFLRKRDP